MIQWFEFPLEFPIINDSIICDKTILVVVCQEHGHRPMSLVRYRENWFWESFFDSGAQWFKPKYVVKLDSASVPTELKDKTPQLMAYPHSTGIEV